MSNDVLLEEVLVQEERALVAWWRAPGAPWNPSAPVALRMPAGLRLIGPGLALGIAQAALRETIDYANAGTMSQVGKHLFGVAAGVQPRWG